MLTLFTKIKKTSTKQIKNLKRTKYIWNQIVHLIIPYQCIIKADCINVIKTYGMSQNIIEKPRDQKFTG